MWTNEETVAAGHSIDPGHWRQSFEAVLTRIAGRFARVDAVLVVDETGDLRLRTTLEGRGIGYFLAVACSHEATAGGGKLRADVLAKEVLKRAWQRLSAGAGAKGHRFYEWAVVDLTGANSSQLLIRRNPSTSELAFYRCYSPAPVVPLTALVRVAGSRWRVEEFFESAKGLAGLDEHQIRRYTSWSRWVTLAMLAHAFLAVVRADEHTRQPASGNLVPLTYNGIQSLFIALVIRPVHEAVHRLHWSHWRRRHQARSPASHDRRQAAAA